MAVTATPIEIPAPGGGGGAINAHLYAPEREPDAAPDVLVLMDAPGVRPALHGMAARLAAAGYRALLPNLYWRRLRDSGFDRAASRGRATRSASGSSPSPAATATPSSAPTSARCSTRSAPPPRRPRPRSATA